ncbi:MULTISPECIES: hypothetical protein [unclassified Oceanispirochaeta]|uniref:hypothetical protein n=1 Tax=unclassified Oceanispirochaeta TaxID=2635722 RepID=UPI000E0927D0|nr:MULTISPECIES: hypothetical protein [unclassified Oceanispirochaeta]MBF9015214.1 hypothetical protein [Oceanispirochaeta sp. M2]NPD71672.1 hypothetical protein [Oceanispirochaeta sp. M1]RDG32869.1 hypothetical protein DV872_06120 [Oceanispirochaeta sp. M1]
MIKSKVTALDHKEIKNKGIQMKKILLLSLATFFLAGSLFAETTKTIIIENFLEETVYYLYLSPVDEREWGEDRLGDDLFDMGSTIEIEITYDESQPIYDLMAEDEMEQSYRIEEINLNETNFISISPESFLPFGGRNPVVREMTFSNETGEDIYYLYVSSRDSMYWGEDLLGDEVLENGATISITIPIDEDYPDNDILAEGETGSSYELMDFNMLEEDFFSITSDDLSQSGDDYSDYDDYDYDDYDNSNGNDEYLQGYKDGFTDAWKEAYSQGFQAAMEQN